MAGDTTIRNDEPPIDGRTTMARRSAWMVIGTVVALIGLIIIAGLRQPTGDPGPLTETLYPLPLDLPALSVTDSSSDWGVDTWKNTSSSQLSGGASLGDINGDGRIDLVIAGGTVGIFLNDGSRFDLVDGTNPDVPSDALSSAIADIDGDGFGDVVIGGESGDLVVIWGGPWVQAGDLGMAETSRLPGDGMATGVLVADLNADERPDLVQLGYGVRSGAMDTIQYSQGDRTFTATDLPDSGGKSLAGQLADIDGDGLVDIWITRDLGWKGGADSLYSRDASGEWRDIAPEIGVAMEIDGMGITVADLTGDGALDGYLSDLGGNEVLVRDGTGFIPGTETGASRIRPPGADAGVVSSSWGSGAIDINLDGILDIVVVNGGMPFADVENKIRGTRVELDDPPAILLGLGGGTYADAWPSDTIAWQDVGRGLALGDIDNDGDTDLVIARLDASPVVLQNNATRRTVSVVPDAGCSPIGALVTVVTSEGTVAQLLGSFSFGGMHAPGISMGEPVVGAPITVMWPEGSEVALSVPPGHRSTITVECAT